MPTGANTITCTKLDKELVDLYAKHEDLIIETMRLPTVDKSAVNSLLRKIREREEAELSLEDEVGAMFKHYGNGGRYRGLTC